MRFSEDFKIGYKDLAGRLFFPAMRWGESRLSPQALYSFLKPFFFARAAVNCAFKKSRYATPRPEFLHVANAAQKERQQKMNGYLNRVLDFFPEKLAEKKWAENCSVEGLEHWQSARLNGRPVVLAFCHFGPVLLLRCLLRGAGIPAATLVGAKREQRLPLKLWKGHARHEPLPGIPLRFFEHQFRGAAEFLTAGNVLLIALDVPAGMQINVPCGDGWRFQMAASAVRFAIQYQADLIPCTIIDKGGWRFGIKLGRPVPRELFPGKASWLPAGKDSWVPLGKHLVDEMIPVFSASPEQCRADLIRCFKPEDGRAI